MKILIKGAGDLASGIACRLHQCGFTIVMTDIAIPTAVRRTVAFSRAVYEKEAVIENSRGILCRNLAEIEAAHAQKTIAVIVDPEADILTTWKPDVLVDAIIAKRNLGTHIEDAPIVIGVGPGFTAGSDCHCVIETKRGHYLGKCIYSGSAIPNTGIPGNIGGYTTERILRAPCDGVFHPTVAIGSIVEKGDICGYVDKEADCRYRSGETAGVYDNRKSAGENKNGEPVGEIRNEKIAGETKNGETANAYENGEPMRSLISGVVRGLLQDGVKVKKGMKSGDVDPRCAPDHCFTVSDKARAIGGGVLEAILHLNQVLH